MAVTNNNDASNNGNKSLNCAVNANGLKITEKQRTTASALFKVWRVETDPRIATSGSCNFKFDRQPKKKKI